MIVHQALPTTIDLIRILFGPLPLGICNLGIFGKNLFFASVSLLTVAATVTKFTFVCIFKSIPVMEDQFLSFYLFFSINIFSCLISFSRLYLPGRPLLNQVICTGQYYKEWIDEEEDAYQTYLFFTIGCLFIYLILTIAIAVGKFKFSVSVHQGQGITLGGMFEFLLTMVMLMLGLASISVLNNIQDPLILNQYPNYLLLYYIYIFLPFLSVVILCLLFYGKNKALRKSFFSFCNHNNAIMPIIE